LSSAAIIYVVSHSRPFQAPRKSDLLSKIVQFQALVRAFQAPKALETKAYQASKLLETEAYQVGLCFGQPTERFWTETE
jgi:hypothetical protein